MPRKKGQTALSIPMSKDEVDNVHRLAKRRSYSITAEYVRSLIEADAEAHGIPFKFDIDRGGYRRRDGSK